MIIMIILYLTQLYNKKTSLVMGARFVKVFFISFRSIPHAQHHSHSSLLPLETIWMRKDCINKIASRLANRGFLC